MNPLRGYSSGYSTMASSVASHMASTPTSPLESQPRHGHGHGHSHSHNHSHNRSPSPTPSLSQGRQPYRSRDFVSFIKDSSRSNALLGYNGLGEHVPFIRQSDLVEYWEEMEIELRLQKHADITNPGQIKNCETIFSILVYIGMPEFIHDFQRNGWTDRKLPLADGHQFDDTPLTQEMLKRFRENQWQFCPLMFRDGHPVSLVKIDPRQILPIKTFEVLKEPLNSDSKTKVCKVTFHEGCTDLSQDNVVVFKEYQVRADETHRASCEREVRTFSSIGSDDHIVRYLGSFEQADRCVVILEYANGGSLWDLFQRQNKPGSSSETRYFWRALTQLSKGISSLHHTLPAIHNMGHVGCAHRDIKPSNILVFYDPPGSYTGTYTLKLADFNVSTEPMASNGTSPQNNDGDRTYRSPEASRVPDYEETQWREIGLDGDIWSFGCVCSEAAVWLGNGMMGLDRYTAQRRSEHTRQLPFQKSGYETCFHDGDKVLQCVRTAHQTAYNSLPRFDELTRQICNIIETAMLVRGHPRGHRLIATQLCSRFDDLLDTIPDIKIIPVDHGLEYKPLDLPNEGASLQGESGPAPKLTGVNPVPPQPKQSPCSPARKTSSRHAKRRQGHTSNSSNDFANSRRVTENKSSRPSSQQQQYPHVSVQDVIRHHKNGWKRDHVEGFEKARGEIGKRHFIFLIDESVTMDEHLEDVVNTAKASIWLLNPFETDKIEVRFSSEPAQQHFQTGSIGQRWIKMTGLSKTKDVVNLIEQRLRQRQKDKKEDVCNMEHCFDSIFNDQVVRAGYKTSVFVLTNGIWQHRTELPGGNVENSIKTLVNKKKKLDMGRTEFCIQFVRFGDDEVGTSRLIYLDDMAKDNKGEVEDIVDHKSHKHSIFPILIGAVSDANDNDSDGDEIDDGANECPEEDGAGMFHRGGAKRYS